jgi:hypothetical protein
MMWRFTKCGISIVRLSAIHAPHNRLFFHEGVSIHRTSWVKEEMKVLLPVTSNNVVSVNNLQRILRSRQHRKSTLHILLRVKYFKIQNLLYSENKDNGFLLKVGTYPAAQLYRPGSPCFDNLPFFRKCCLIVLLNIQNYKFLQIKYLLRCIT